MDKEELTLREREAWEAFRREVDRLPPDLLERLIESHEGWTVKDVLWHIAHWWDDLADMLDRIRAGTFVDDEGTDEETDAENAQVLAESREMTLAEVRSGVEAARDRMLAAWGALPKVTDVARKWFVWETIEHYEEHVPQLRGLARD